MTSFCDVTAGASVPASVTVAGLLSPHEAAPSATPAIATHAQRRADPKPADPADDEVMRLPADRVLDILDSLFLRMVGWTSRAGALAVLLCEAAGSGNPRGKRPGTK
jgi:hypothetical protein